MKPPRRSPDPAAGRVALDWAGALAVFESLSRPGRLAVFRAVLRAGPDGVETRALAHQLKTTGSALTFHLRALHGAGLVRPAVADRAATEGRRVVLVADLETLEAMLALLKAEAGGLSGRPLRPVVAVMDPAPVRIETD